MFFFKLLNPETQRKTTLEISSEYFSTQKSIFFNTLRCANILHHIVLERYKNFPVSFFQDCVWTEILLSTERPINSQKSEP